MIDAITALADRCRTMSEFQFAIEWGSLTEDERNAFLALVQQRTARAQERLETIQEDNRVLIALAMLVVRSDAPPGTTLVEALSAGYVGVMEVVETIRADPLAP